MADGPTFRHPGAYALRRAEIQALEVKCNFQVVYAGNSHPRARDVKVYESPTVRNRQSTFSVSDTMCLCAGAH